MPSLKSMLGKIGIKIKRPGTMKAPKNKKKSPKKSGSRKGAAEEPANSFPQDAPPCWGEREIRRLVELGDSEDGPQGMAEAVEELERLKAVSAKHAKAHHPHGKKSRGVLFGSGNRWSKKNDGRHSTAEGPAKSVSEEAPPCWGEREIWRLAELGDSDDRPQATAAAVLELDRLMAVSAKHAKARPRGKKNRGFLLGGRREEEEVQAGAFSHGASTSEEGWSGLDAVEESKYVK